MDNEILAIIKPSDSMVPHMAYKAKIKRYPFKAPFLA